MSSSRSVLLSRLAVLALVIAGLPGCSFLRGDGTKQRLDEPRDTPHHPTGAKLKPMLVEVTTDASGAVVTVEFKRSSGSSAVDNYVAENIRHNWPSKPSNRSLVELTYTVEKGFSEPRLISSAPVPQDESGSVLIKARRAAGRNARGPARCRYNAACWEC